MGGTTDPETGTITKPTKGGIHAFHGWGMPADAMYGFGQNVGPQFNGDGQQVSIGELKHAANYLKKYEPKELYVYSRGSAVWARVQDSYPDIAAKIGKVNYLAPAKLRTMWGAADVSLDNKNGEVYAAAQDGKVPVKQAAKIAQDIGQSTINIVDINTKKDVSDASSFGTKGHANARILAKHQNTTAVPVEDVLNNDDFPDWQDASADEEDLLKQMRATKDVADFTPTGLEEVRILIRELILGSIR